MAVSRYANADEIRALLGNVVTDYDSIDINSMLSTDINGIEGLPYQFLNTVDARIPGTNVGRKYNERVFSKAPLVFLTPCEPVFMDDFSSESQNVFASALLGQINTDNLESLLDNNSGKYYTTEFNYADYYADLNLMLKSVAHFMGIQNKKIFVNGSPKKVGNVNWENELNSAFKSFFSCRENLVFFADSLDTVTESFTNETTESQLAGTINGISDTVNELRFLFGTGKNNTVSSIIEGSKDKMQEALSSTFGTMSSQLAGGIVGSLVENSPFLDGGKIVFPKIWSNSTFDRSYQLDFKFRSPDHDNLSIFLNVIKPYCKLLALTMPRSLKGDPNSFRSPFLVRAAAKGMFNIDMGIISSLSANKGANCQWNDDGLPTQIDVSITIDDLYSSLHMTDYGEEGGFTGGIKNAKNMAYNTAYMDFLCNMAGLNIAQMERGRKIEMFTYLSIKNLTSTPATMRNKLSQIASSKLMNVWDMIPF